MLARSTSMPKYGTKQEDPGRRAPARAMSGWTPWLLAPAKSATKYEARRSKAVEPRSRRRPTPVLTLALFKLEQELPKFIKIIETPSYENAAAAAAVLDSAVATASPQGSPRTTRPAPSKWGTPTASPSRHPAVSSSALALEGEWEKFETPFLLLAAAEAIYADLSHVMKENVAPSLGGLYKRIAADLVLVREILCDPFLLAKKQDGTVSATNQTYRKAAVSLNGCVLALEAVCSVRRQLIRLHTNMFKERSLDLLRQCSLDFENLLEPLTRHSQVEGVAPLVQTLEQEIKTWKLMNETAYYLGRCRFVETVLCANKLKNHIEKVPRTTLELWFLGTLTKLISIMPIIFDRIDAFSKPLYGFTGGSPGQNGGTGVVHDLEAAVVDFLRRQEKAGGSPTAVAVVVNAARTDNFRVERGFTLVADATDNNDASFKAIDPPATTHTDHARWPAVYMRTSTRLGAATSGWPPSGNTSGILSSMRRNNSLVSPQSLLHKAGSVKREDEDSSWSQANLLQSWTVDSSPRGKNRKNSERKANLNVLEYDHGSATWPYSEWSNLVALVEDEGNDEANSAAIGSERGQPRYPERAETAVAPSGAGFAGFSIWAIPVEHDASERPNSPPENTTVIDVRALSDVLWLVLMVKSEEDSRWHRRRKSGLLHEHMQKFLDFLASRLCVSNLFLVESIQLQEISKNLPSNIRRELVTSCREHISWDDIDLSDFSRLVKDSFGLRPREGMVESLKSPYIGFRSFGRRSPDKRRGWKSSDLFESAAALFLGSDLHHVVS